MTDDFWRDGGPGYTVTAERDKDGDCQLVLKIRGVTHMILTLRKEQMQWLGHDCLRAAGK